ncbi:VOC family protein [Methanosarcinales archaeon]|nr:MAG: VOC family protein [Methanosarcinales archaeon]
MKVSYAAITVKDLEESVKFYTEILGLKEVRRFSPHERMTIAFLKGEGNGMIELIEGMDKSEWKIDSGQALLLVGLEVSDMDATVQALWGKGIDFTRGPIEVQGGTKIAFLKDPNGVGIELIQP